MKALSFGVAGVMLVWSGYTAAAETMRPGLWEITTAMEMTGVPGMGSMKMPSQTIKHCYTESDVSDGKKVVPAGDDAKCKVSDYKTSGSTTSWKVACTGDHAMTGEGKITYAKDAYTGTMKADMDGMNMVQKYDAKRLGDCKK